MALLHSWFWPTLQKCLNGSLQERVVLFHVTTGGSFFKTTRTFEAQVQ